MTPTRVALAALLVALAAGCFDVRSLDRRFDAEVDADPSADGGSEAGPRCARLDSVCDGVDEDCDGRYDEDFVAVEVCGIGVCRVNSSPGRCVSGFPIDCLPGMDEDETCDNLDNDCDGKIDEALTRPCGDEPVGLCTRGVERCAAGAWGACDGVDPVGEQCDGLDQDCDGQVDEGLTRDCPDGTGQCGDGVQQCDDGEWQGCDAAEPSPEQCNGVDDDCDGAVDEGIGPRVCGSATGACRQGETTCRGGAWGACVGEVAAVAESCNGLDDDCNGQVDEGDGPCGACGLRGRPVCAVGVEPCPAGPPLVLCIAELGSIDGDQGQELGRQLAAGGDLDEDGIDDFVARTRQGVEAISGVDASEFWSRNNLVVNSSSMAVADLGEDPRREVLVGDASAEGGQVRAVGPGSQLQGSATGGAALGYGHALAAVDGFSRVAVGDPTADDGGVVRLLQYEAREFGRQWTDIRVDGATGFGGVITMARDADGEVVLLATITTEEGRRVVLLRDLVRMANPPVSEVIAPGRGVGERLVMGPMMAEVPPLLAALNASQPWVDVVEPTSAQGARLPLDDVGRDLAILPARGAAPPLLVVAMDSGLRFIRIDPESSAMVVDFPYPPEVMSGSPGFTPTVAASAIGPDGSRLVAIGAIGDLFVRGRVHIYRIE